MPKRVLQGVVVSDKSNKTVVVNVERRVTHPILRKVVRKSKKFHAHDETNQYKIGDIVFIEESRPISKLKSWQVIGKVNAKKAQNVNSQEVSDVAGNIVEDSSL